MGRYLIIIIPAIPWICQLSNVLLHLTTVHQIAIFLATLRGNNHPINVDIIIVCEICKVRI